MYISLLPNDLISEILKFLEISEIRSLHLTSVSLNKDVEKYSIQIKKMSFNDLIKKYICLHCNNIHDYKICNNCITDTCWNCFRKIGQENLKVVNCNIDGYYSLIFLCIRNCKYKCKNCLSFYKKEYIWKNEKDFTFVCYFCINKFVIDKNYIKLYKY